MSELGLKRCGELVVVVIGRAGSGQVLLHYRDARTSMSSLIDARFSIASAAHGFHVSVVKLVETPQPLGVRSCSPTSQFCGRLQHPTCVWSSLRYGTQRRRRSVQSYDARSFLARHARYRSLDGQFLYSSMLERALDGRTP